ncbi:hypothetical protein APS56_03485 [Pseudalgibacter alginicilyticus]|uniref:DUF4251 domain-containing protein n=1 Tax=Pseudalgibacter alginicilyticus TaxID=1736674 RepID=A0A0P0CV40_9FLAO|nr:DUF4251 domain-containing protein [Pseudalgibacter alginicilyticus]ALJ04259.1 hypothetical protein APS56_03485 [Pseudalgibacter alginicilyticus]
MKPFAYYIISIALILVSCSSLKTNVSQASIDALDQLVRDKHFRIESDWAYPQTTAAMQQIANSGLLGVGNSANAISLIGNYNHLTISGDSITSYLPYFGERQMQVDYSATNSAIQFNGIIKNYTSAKNKDNSYTISFEAKSKSENFNVSVKIYPNLRSNMALSGMSRFSIQYSGTVELITQ